MKLHLKITPNDRLVPFDHLPKFVGAFHKWLGPDNPYHDDSSLYSLSWLKGGFKSQEDGKEGLNFSNGAIWTIGAHSNDFMRDLFMGIHADPRINFGMKVTGIDIEETPVFGRKAVFMPESPVFLKRNIGENGEKTMFYYYDSEEADALMTETAAHKMQKAGIAANGFFARFDKAYPKAKIKAVNYGRIFNKGSVCPVLAEGTPEQLAFFWSVGAGNSTGIGFGALKYQ